MMDTGDLYSQAYRQRRDRPCARTSGGRQRREIDWRGVDPAALPDGSLVRAALEDGRPDIAAWIASQFPGGGRAYVHSDTTHRGLLYTEEARKAVASGEMSAREAEVLFGVCRDRL